MADEWRLSDVAEIIMGQSPPGETYNEYREGLPFFQGVADFGYRHPTPRVYCSKPSRIAQPGDILLSVRAPIGRVNVADRLCAIGRGLSIIRAKNRYNARYLEFALRYLEPHWHAIEGSGSVFGNATRSDLEKLAIPWPEGDADRQAIAHILGTLDDKIELNRRMNETLEAMARALFKSWFIDFDPVHRNIARRTGQTQPSPGPRPPSPSGRGAGGEGAQDGRGDYRGGYDFSELVGEGGIEAFDALFPDSFQDSPLGKIPEGWSVRRLDVVAHFLNGLALQKYPPNGDAFLPVIKIAQLRKGSTEGADRAAADLPQEYVVQDGDVLFAWSGSLEVVIWCGGKGALNQHLFKVTSRHYPKWFYYFWTKEHLPTFQAIASGKATTMGHIQRHHLTEAKVLVPPAELVDAMDSVFGPIVQAIVGNNLQSRTLANLRDTLLPKLISGEVRVPLSQSPAEVTT
ncbi:MAG TPA: restriction endonuclease subunit S [Methylomirabilota bacterium]|nr:restriction endonuclease subunit S [Methylomirabilota bacterium]